MKEKELRRSMPVFPIGSVMRLTDLTARQIRYYEDQGLIKPERTDGNQRLFSLNDMDKLLEIKDLLAEGMSLAKIKRQYDQRHQEHQAKPGMSDDQLRRLFREEFRNQAGFGSPDGTFGQRPF